MLEQQPLKLTHNYTYTYTYTYTYSVDEIERVCLSLLRFSSPFLMRIYRPTTTIYDPAGAANAGIAPASGALAVRPFSAVTVLSVLVAGVFVFAL